MARTMDGVIAPPRRAKLCVMPCAKPRSRTGSQNVKARVAVGNAPPSPAPTRRRNTTSEATLHDNPVMIVADAHKRLKTASTRRGPNRSDSQPPTICVPAYGYAKAEKMSPS